MNSIVRNIHFQRCKCVSFCWTQFYLVMEGISYHSKQRELGNSKEEAFLEEGMRFCFFTYWRWTSLKCSEGGFIHFLPPPPPRGYALFPFSGQISVQISLHTIKSKWLLCIPQLKTKIKWCGNCVIFLRYLFINKCLT